MSQLSLPPCPLSASLLLHTNLRGQIPTLAHVFAALESPFVALFDGDTEPHRDFLTRTLPLFYRFEPETKRWRVNWEVGFVQTRQRFKNVAHRFGPDDPLNQSNGVFFSATQVRASGRLIALEASEDHGITSVACGNITLYCIHSCVCGELRGSLGIRELIGNIDATARGQSMRKFPSLNRSQAVQEPVSARRLQLALAFIAGRPALYSGISGAFQLYCLLISRSSGMCKPSSNFFQYSPVLSSSDTRGKSGAESARAKVLHFLRTF